MLVHSFAHHHPPYIWEGLSMHGMLKDFSFSFSFLICKLQLVLRDAGVFGGTDDWLGITFEFWGRVLHE